MHKVKHRSIRIFIFLLLLHELAPDEKGYYDEGAEEVEELKETLANRDK